jgi:drug/metabolite transporter (DMT)-like permease
MSRRGWLLFAAISVFWGIPYFFIKIAVQAVDPTVVVFARVGIAAVVLLPLALRANLLHRLQGHWRAIALLAAVQVLGPFLLITYGEQRIASSLTSVLVATEPLLVAALAFSVDARERVAGLRLVGLGVGLAGVATLVGLDVGVDGPSLSGAGMVLVATAGYALAALLLRRQPYASLPSLGVVTAECLLAALVILPLALSRLPARLPRSEVTLSLLILGLMCTAIAWLTFFALIAEVGASRGTVFTYVNPAISVLLGVALLGEAISAAMIVGFILVLVGSWLSTGGTLPLPLNLGKRNVGVAPGVVPNAGRDFEP